MTYDRTFIESENDGKLDWDANNAVWYSVVNKDAVNKYGEYRGYKIMPGKSSINQTQIVLVTQFLTLTATGNKNHLVIKNSTDLGPSINWGTNHLYAIRQHDNELHSTYPYNAFDQYNPVIDFGKYFNGESLDQEDLVM